MSPATDGASMVLLRGLPYSATVDDVLQLFSAFPKLTTDCVQVLLGTDGRTAVATFPGHTKQGPESVSKRCVATALASTFSLYSYSINQHKRG